jgi:hypothetical protein
MLRMSQQNLAAYLNPPSSAAGSPASLSVVQESKEEKTTPDIYGLKCCGLSANSNPDGLWEKMSRDLLKSLSMTFSIVLKEKVTPRGHTIFQLRRSALATSEIGSLLLPTILRMDIYKPLRPRCPSEKNGKHGTMVVAALGDMFPNLNGQYLNPSYVEKLMGLPEGWTVLYASEMQLYLPKCSRSYRQSHKLKEVKSDGQ